VSPALAGAGVSANWRVDLAAKTVALASERHQAGAQACATWQVVGDAGIWEQVIRGGINLNVALRRRELRYCDTGGPASVSAARMSMLADLLGITSWRSTPSTPSQPRAAAVA
jgi:hypothetical protein